MQRASDITGLADFGDPARRAPLDVYLSALRQDSWEGMNNRSRHEAIDNIVYHLGTRLRLVNDRQCYPQIVEQRIERPFIIVGPPRSGSTLLHTLLAQDPDNRAPEHWLCFEPSPPLALAPLTKDRLDRTQKRLMALFDLVPDVFISHPYMIEEGSAALAECGSDILNMVFTCQELWVFYGSESRRSFRRPGSGTGVVPYRTPR